MTDEQKAAFVMAQAACVNAMVAAYQAVNDNKRHLGQPPVYGKQDFEALIEQYGVHHNAVVGMFA